MAGMIQDMPDDERPRERLERLGPEALSNAELLAIFLRVGTKGVSAIEIGENLLKHFGSIAALGSATIDDLKAQHGIGLAKACQLAAAFELGARAAREQLNHVALDSPERIHETFAPQLAYLDHERLVIALVNTRLQHTGTIEISSGTLNETTAHPRDVLRPVVARNAYGFVLIHNHPSGDPSPSTADREFTRRINRAAELFQLRFVDHIIIGRPQAGRDPYYSFREAGVL